MYADEIRSFGRATVDITVGENFDRNEFAVRVRFQKLLSKRGGTRRVHDRRNELVGRDRSTGKIREIAEISLFSPPSFPTRLTSGNPRAR